MIQGDARHDTTHAVADDLQRLVAMLGIRVKLPQLARQVLAALGRRMTVIVVCDLAAGLRELIR